MSPSKRTNGAVPSRLGLGLLSRNWRPVIRRRTASAVTIPEEALVTFAGVIKVFVIEDKMARPVEVKPGLRMHVGDAENGSNWLEVTGDLEADSLVVTSGHSQLANGTPVRLRSAGNARSDEDVESQPVEQVSRR